MGEAEQREDDAIAPVQRLTPAQRRLLLAYARTGTHAAVAHEFGLAPSTVKNHLANAYERLGVHNGQQAIYLVMGGDDVARDLAPELPTLPRPRLATSAPYASMPVMIDGQISLDDLRTAARIGDAEADGSPRATLSECIEFLSYYVRPRPRSTEAVAGS